MKKFALAALLCAATASAFAGDLKALDFNFIAPAVPSTSDAPNQVGLIIFDSTNNVFWGRGSGSSDWQQLTNLETANLSLSNLASPTAVSQDLSPGATDSKNLGNVDYAWQTAHLTNGVEVQTLDDSTGFKGGISWVTQRPYSDEMAYIRAYRTGTGGAPTDLVFGTTDSAPTTVERMRILSNGLITMSGPALKLPTATSDPGSPAAGWVYFNTSTSKLRLYDGSMWVDLN